MTEDTAIIIGASGLVGSALLKLILADPQFSKIKSFARNSAGIDHPKLEEYLIDFDKINTIKDKVRGDVLFSCLGTTMGKAGSKDAQYKVDYTYQYEFANYANQNGVSSYLLISSASADSNSMFFYTRMKGELEDAVKELSFSKIRILQPSVLQGDRKEERFGERLGGTVINALSKVIPPLRKYRSITGPEVARAMVAYYKDNHSERVVTFKLDELFTP